jgi:hypothetical protein
MFNEIETADALVAAYLVDAYEVMENRWLALLDERDQDDASALVLQACDRNLSARFQAHNVHRAICHWLMWRFPSNHSEVA